MLGSCRRSRRALLALLCASVAPAQAGEPTCEKTFEGETFLAEAQRRGISLTSDCNKVDLATDEFYGLPDRPCTCVFEGAEWLADGWRFVRLTGEGYFSVERGETALTVTIAPAGGFRVDAVTVEAHVGQCGEMGLPDVLR